MLQFLAVLVIPLSLLAYFSRVRLADIETAILKHLAVHHPEDWKILIIPVPLSDHEHLLGIRILKDSASLPHDNFLDLEYRLFKRYFWLATSLGLAWAFFVIMLRISDLEFLT